MIKASEATDSHRSKWSITSAVALTLISCGQPTPNRDDVLAAQPLDARARMILKRIGLTMPPSIKVDHAEYQEGQDDNARLVLTMPAADWAKMQAAPPLDVVDADAYTSLENVRLGNEWGNWPRR